ncbi:MAG: bestrophin family ion channel [Acidobacteriota bacterium]|nr:bestrophin family ion channel [Acidobacteriota bacterium]
MFTGRNYSLKEFLVWTRREIFFLLVVGAVPTVLYGVVGWKWLVIPWLPIALIGTAVAFVVGFKNNASYERMWEARRAWGGIVNASRAWGILVKDYITNKHALTPLSENELKAVHRQLIHRHLAWLTALRFQLREPRSWESMDKAHNAEYRQKYSVHEQENHLHDELTKFLAEEEFKQVAGKKNKAVQIVGLQSKHLRELLDAGLIEDFRHMELEKTLIEFYNHQGVCERIKNFPYPRQFATLNLFFVKLFIVMVPFGMLQEFDKLGLKLVWLNIPFSVLVSWVFMSMEKIGEATENPFEGSANDIPITTLSRNIEIDLKEMLDETEIPAAIQPVHQILM